MATKLEEFVSKITSLLHDYGHDEYVKAIPSSMTLPVGMSDKSMTDPVKEILECFEFNLQYGSIDNCLVETPDHLWFPFIVSYDMFRNVTIILVDLVTKRVAYKKIRRETDYTPGSETDYVIKTSPYTEPFLLPNKNYAEGVFDPLSAHLGAHMEPSAGYDLWEPQYDVHIEEDEEKIHLIFDNEDYLYDKTTECMTYMGETFEPDDEEGDNYYSFMMTVIKVYRF